MYENREQHEHREDDERERKFERETREKLAELEKQEERQDKLLEEILEDVKPSHTVTGGQIFLLGDPMTELKPGNSPKFAVSPLPAGAKTFANQVAVSSADPADVLTLDPADPTGQNFTVTINPAATEPVSLSLTWTYTNTSGSVATVTGNFSEVIEVTGGTMTQVG